jgi:hypothetical protein
MAVIKPLAETHETVTLSRADFDSLLHAAEDAADLAAVEAHRASEDRVGWETARRHYLSADEARRLLDGENPVRVWRAKRGVTRRAPAAAVGATSDIGQDMSTKREHGQEMFAPARGAG